MIVFEFDFRILEVLTISIRYLNSISWWRKRNIRTNLTNQNKKENFLTIINFLGYFPKSIELKQKQR